MTKKQNKLDRKSKNSRGNIVIPILFVVLAFAVLLTSGKMFNTSVTDPNEKFDNPIVSDQGNKKNLQIKDLQFTKAQPPSVGKTCDGSQQGYGKVIKKAEANACCYYHAFTDDCSVCCAGACVDKNSPLRDGYYPGTEPPQDAQYWCDAKPIIYLYPQVPTLVNVEIIVPGEIIVSDPLYPKGGWKNILALPNGNFYYKKNVYKELFYEATVTPINPPSHGTIVEAINLEKDLTEIVQNLGLVGQETKDFVSYWAPKLKSLNSKYILVSFFDKIEKQPIDKVVISPKPDTFIEFIMYFKPLDDKEFIQPIIYTPVPERLGFTAVEWGGVIDD